MARNDTITLSAGVWTQLTNSDVAAIRVQNQGGWEVALKATVGAVPPTDHAGDFKLGGLSAVAANYLLADVWPGVPGANRVYAWAAQPVNLSVSHA